MEDDGLSWRLVLAHWPQLGLAFALLILFGDALADGDGGALVMVGLAMVCGGAWLLGTEDDHAKRGAEGPGDNGRDHRGGDPPG